MNKKKIIELKKETEVKFCSKGGYECLGDDLEITTCTNLSEVQSVLDDFYYDYDESIGDFVVLAKSIEERWIENNSDGGGSGWIEF